MPELNIEVPTMGKVEVTDNGSLVYEVQSSLSSNANLVTECGFYVGTSSSMEDAEKYQCKLTGKTFATTLFLEGYSRKYYICSYISNGKSELLSEKKIIRVGALADYVTFGGINIDSYEGETETATLSTSCSVKEGVNVDSYGILYGTSSDLVKSGTSVEIKFPSPSESAIIQLSGIKAGTKYYICQYLTDNGTTVYQNTIDFNAYALPTVTLGEISDITTSTATVSGTVADEGGAVILGKGIVYAEGTSTPTVESGKVQSMGMTQDISVTLTGLSPNTLYTVRAYATNIKGTSYSAESKTFTTKVALPQVTTGEASSVTSTSATLNAKINDDGGETPSEFGFYWSDAQFTDPSSANKIEGKLSWSSFSAFSASLTDLNHMTSYFYQAYAITSAGIAYGELKSFATTAALPTVTTAEVTDISNDGAKSGGEVTDDGGALVTRRGVVWSTEPNPTVSLMTKTEDGSGKGSFTSTMTGLTRATKYYVRAYATSSKGTAYGEEQTFTTKVPLAEVITQSATSVTSASATLNATINDDGGETPSECGFYWSETAFTDPSSANKTEGKLSGSSFSVSLTDLNHMTSYFYQAYAITSAGIAYGELKSFATTAALPTVTTAEVTDIGNDGAKSGGEVTDDGGASVTRRGVVWSTEPNPTVSLMTKTEDGSGKGSFTSNVTGLALGTTYYLRAYATNSAGTTYGEERTFRTPVILSVVMTESAASITSESAVLNATLASTGGEDPAECGFCWSAVEFTDASSASKVTATLSGYSFSAKLDNLNRSTTYYYQAYSKNSAGTSYGEIRSFKTSAELPKVTTASIDDITSSGATCGGTVTDDGGASITQRGVVWSTSPNPTVSLSTKTKDGPGNGSFTSTMTGLTRATKYYVRAYAVNEIGVSYGDERSFITQASKATVTTLPATSATLSSAELNARIDDDGGLSIFEAGFYWSDAPIDEPSGATKIISSVSGTSFKAQLTNLTLDAIYYYRAYAINSLGISYGEERSFTVSDLSSVGTANCYIVSKSGAYKFKTVKGNSSTSVGNVSTCEVLWESFGTSTTPSIGDLIKSVIYKDGYIGFETATTFREGNAVIAAKDANGTILWSWHIWLTDQPQGQTYNNGAGVMMDRNLGATSSTPGDVGALGLLYQWGRKDPFMNSSSISDDIEAKSTITWPSSVSSSSSQGTIAYATAHPTTFITENKNNHDWYYSSGSSTDNTRWRSSKTVYDPCPAGWRVPDGGSSGVWSKAFGIGSYWSTSYYWEYANHGTDFSKTDKKLGSSGPIWYPASGYRSSNYNQIYVGINGYYWSVSPSGYNAYCLDFNYYGISPASRLNRAYGYSVRCLKE